jgi:hypothetical protein
MRTVKARKKEAFCSLLVCPHSGAFWRAGSKRSSEMELKYCECVISVIVRCKTPAHGQPEISEISG